MCNNVQVNIRPQTAGLRRKSAIFARNLVKVCRVKHKAKWKPGKSIHLVKTTSLTIVRISTTWEKRVDHCTVCGKPHLE